LRNKLVLNCTHIMWSYGKRTTFNSACSSSRLSCGRKSDTTTSFLLWLQFSLVGNISPVTPYIFIHLSATLYNLSKWQRRNIQILKSTFYIPTIRNMTAPAAPFSDTQFNPRPNFHSVLKFVLVDVQWYSYNKIN